MYTPATPLTPDAPLVFDPRSVEFLGAWFGFAASVLEQVRAEADSLDQPSRVQLWPEHFDLSVDLGDEQAGRRGTFGATPGDAVDPDPYLYVTHWADVVENEYWNEEHFPGASLTVATLAAAPDQRTVGAHLRPPGAGAAARPLTTNSGSSGVATRSSTTSRKPARSR